MSQKLKLLDFNEHFLSDLKQTEQVLYIRRYLNDLGAKKVLEEAEYFDRDYLSEFSVFYSQSSIGHPNICKRLHIFSSTEVNQDILYAALGGEESSRELLKKNYLGFIVIRPIKSAPLGMTVLAWYPEHSAKTPRVTNPSRTYKISVYGIELEVKGLAWQQQDRAVSACASISLWTMLQSSALDDFHYIPTTAEITAAANKKTSYGKRVYPAAHGLTVHQICEALNEVGLSPCTITGELNNGYFSKERFADTCSAFMRSGYPILLGGELIFNDTQRGGHAVCAVGFRENSQNAVEGKLTSQDQSVNYLYVHDDNIGPNVRFGIFTDPQGVALIKPSKPDSATGEDPIKNCGVFVPNIIIAAIHNDLKADPDELHIYAISVAQTIQDIPNLNLGITYGARFIKKENYIGHELGAILGSRPNLLSEVRLSLAESVRPMGNHLGLIRIANGSMPILDLLLDTTDNELMAYASIVYLEGFDSLCPYIEKSSGLSLGNVIKAYVVAPNPS